MKVKALKVGWDNVALRKVGEVFDYDGPLGSWMEVVKVPEKTVTKKPAAKKPKTKKATKPAAKKAATKKVTKN